MTDATPRTPMADNAGPCELTILMPCLNEALTLPTCIGKAMGFLQRAGIRGEVVIADNGSTDGSQDIARSLGARVVDIPVKGYGAALIGGIKAAHGTYVIMGDSDDSYDFANLDLFVARLRDGADLVMGNRFKGGIKPGAMPPLHRYLGNPVLTFIGRLLFRSPCGDFHCGLRGFNRQSILGLDLHTTGMEFASEMVVKATLRGLTLTEVPTTLSPDGRDRPPHLRSWRDGWRHLRFLVLFSPAWLFLYPGLALTALGGIGMTALIGGPVRIGGTTFDVHSMLVAAALILIGAQAATFAAVATEHGMGRGLLPESNPIGRLTQRVSLEAWLIAGGTLAVCGVAAILVAVAMWGQHGFGSLDNTPLLRLVIPGVTAAALGVQLVFTGFLRAVVTLPSD